MDVDVHRPVRFLHSVWGSLALLLLLVLPSANSISHDLTLALLGDVMLGRGVARVHSDHTWETAFAALAPQIKRADIALANLESPLSDSSTADEGNVSGGSTFNLCAPASGVQALTSAGLNLLSLANNHAQDCTDQQQNETNRILERAGLEGIPPDFTPLWKEIDGQKLAFFAFDDISSPLDSTAAAQAVAQARLADGIVVVSIHWGDEYQAGVSNRQVALAQVLSNAGATLIWGHHPHVLQKVAWVQGNSLPYPTLVAYSLGNALFDQPAMPDLNRSALLLVRLRDGRVQSVQAVPFQINPRQACIVPASEETAALIRERLMMSTGKIVNPGKGNQG